MCGPGHLDGGAALVPGGAQDFFDEDVDDGVDVVVGIAHKQIDRPDEAAGADRRPEGQDGRPDDRPMRFDHEHGRLRQIHELAEQIRRDERGVTGGLRCRLGAQRDESIDIRDPSRSNLVIHADGQ